MVASAHGSPEAPVTAHIPLEAAVTAYQPPKASSPFLGYLGLITNGQDPPLMSVRAALSVRVLSKEVVRSQKSPKATLTGSADVSSEVAELVSGFLEAVEPTDVSPEAAVSAHRASEAAASSHSAPDTAMPTHTAPEAVEPADMSPEVAGLASGPLEAVEPTDVSSETAVFAHTAHKALYAPMPAHTAPEAEVSARKAPDAEVSAHTAPEAVVSAPTTWAWPPHPFPLLRPRSAIPLVGGLGTTGPPPSHRQKALPPFLLDSSTSLHTPVYPLITPSWSQSVDYLYTSPPSLWWRDYPY